MVRYALVGHQERRRYFHETVRDVAAKVRECVDAGITPIICMDEHQITEQLAAIEEEDERKVYLAFTPKDGIGFESKRNFATIARVCSDLAMRSGGQPVLYGGGVEAGNAARLLEMDELAGILVAGASHDLSSFLSLIEGLPRS
jgi:triosephosphate isomerase